MLESTAPSTDPPLISIATPATGVSPLTERWRHVFERATAVVPPAGHYLVIAPHPDDETLTVGGLIALLVLRGADVHVLGVTDGGNAYPEHIGHDELARVRRGEQIVAVEHLGVSADRLTSLGFRDGDVAEHEDELVEAIAHMSTPSTTIVAPWVHDVHADHEAVGRAAQRAAEKTGCSVWFSLFWAWHHAPVASMNDVDLIRIDIDDAVQTEKAAALHCHASQLQFAGVDPILGAGTLEPARWPCEYFVLDCAARRHR